MVTIEMVSVEHFEQLRLKKVPTKPDSMIIIFGIELEKIIEALALKLSSCDKEEITVNEFEVIHILIIITTDISC